MQSSLYQVLQIYIFKVDFKMYNCTSQLSPFNQRQIINCLPSHLKLVSCLILVTWLGQITNKGIPLFSITSNSFILNLGKLNLLSIFKRVKLKTMNFEHYCISSTSGTVKKSKVLSDDLIQLFKQKLHDQDLQQ